MLLVIVGGFVAFRLLSKEAAPARAFTALEFAGADADHTGSCYSLDTVLVANRAFNAATRTWTTPREGTWTLKLDDVIQGIGGPVRVFQTFTFEQHRLASAPGVRGRLEGHADRSPVQHRRIARSPSRSSTPRRSTVVSRPVPPAAGSHRDADRPVVARCAAMSVLRFCHPQLSPLAAAPSRADRMSFATTPGSLLILGAILVMSALALWVSPGILERNLLRPYWLLRRRQYDTIITSGFIHGDAGHLLFNCLTFFFFAPQLEQRIGTARFVALLFRRPGAQQPGHGVQAAQQPRLRGARSFGRDSRGAVCVHRLLPQADALSVLRDSDSRGGICVRLRGVQLVGIEEPARQHQPRCASRWCDHGLIFVGLTDFDAWSRAIHQVFG